MLQIQPTATNTPDEAKSPQRQLVDASDPTYSNQHLSDVANPTKGSWWMLQIQPTAPNPSELAKSHQRQLVDASDPTYRNQHPGCRKSHQRQLVDASDPAYSTNTSDEANPTNGSWWDSEEPPSVIQTHAKEDAR
jgi:hypothetical protein